jgi:hypothetical protein
MIVVLAVGMAGGCSLGKDRGRSARRRAHATTTTTVAGSAEARAGAMTARAASKEGGPSGGAGLPTSSTRRRSPAGAVGAWCDLAGTADAKGEALHHVANADDAVRAAHEYLDALDAVANDPPREVKDDVATALDIGRKLMAAYERSGYSSDVIDHPEEYLSSSDYQHSLDASQAIGRYRGAHC